MADFIIITDTREQAPYSFSKWDVETMQASLETGDYSLRGFENQVAVERKNLDDLISCFMGANRDRFEKELIRGRRLDLFAVVIEATLEDIAQGRFKSQMKPVAALQTVAAFAVRYGTPFMFCGSRAGAEYMTFSLLSKYIYEIEKRYKIYQKKCEVKNGIQI